LSALKVSLDENSLGNYIAQAQRLRIERDAARDETNRLQAKVSELTDSNNRYARDRQDQDAHLQETYDANADMVQQLKDARELIDILRKELDNAGKKEMKLKDAKSIAEKRASEAREEQKRLNKENSALKRELHKSRNSEGLASIEIIGNQQKKIQALEAEITRLQQIYNGDVGQLRDSKSDLQAQLHKAISKIRALEATLAEKNNEDAEMT